MISPDNPAAPLEGSKGDFTTSHYRELVRMACNAYPVATYADIPWGKRFLLWRHDCDYSLNRALALARIEHEEGLHATYFVNPHSEFYNLLERSQVDAVGAILAMGHGLGLHFDGMFHASSGEADLERQLESEARLLALAFGARPHAFSFHNPSAFHLGCERETYAGMTNCYSWRFKADVGYCSDSNGHWRFRRLHDVLAGAADRSLQVLTHPGWWQEEAMTPRERIARCVYGRADATLDFYDAAIEAGGRQNPSGPSGILAFLREANPDAYRFCDELLHRRRYATLYLELWRLLMAQVRRACSDGSGAGQAGSAPAVDLPWPSLDARFGPGWRAQCPLSAGTLGSLPLLRDRVMAGTESPGLEQGCKDLCSLVAWLADGIAPGEQAGRAS